MIFKENESLTRKEASKKYSYLNLLMSCYESAINRLDPLNPEFNDNFDELFEKRYSCIEELNEMIEKRIIVIHE